MPPVSRDSFATAGYPLFVAQPHRVLVGLAGGATLAVTWLAGGETPAAVLVYVTLACASLLPLFALHRAGHAVDWKWLLPPLLVLGYVSISLLNPSHLTDPATGGWHRNPDWIRWLPTTMDRTITWHTLSPLLATLVLGGSLAAARLPPSLVRGLWLVLFLNGLLLALMGATLKFAGTTRFMGLFPTKLDYFFATFTYRNHWAAYALLTVALGGGFALSYLRRWSSDPANNERARFFAISTLLIAFTPMLPGSRSGSVMMLGLGSLLILQGLTILRRRGRRGRRQAVFLAIGLAGLLIAFASLGYPTLQRRFADSGGAKQQWRELSSNIRVQFTRDTVRMAADRPWFGWGLGTFRYVFPRYQGDYLRDEAGRITTWVDKAHNDWAQTWAELGAAGVVLLITPVGALVLIGRRSTSTLARTALLGVGVIAIYAVMEFPLRNLAVAAHVAVLLGTFAQTDRPPVPGDDSRKHLIPPVPLAR